MSIDEIIAGMTEAEVWLPIRAFEGLYEVSNFGRVKSLGRVVVARDGRRLPIPERIMALGRTRKGYLFISLHKEGKAYPKELHRLVCEAFHGVAPEGMEAAHIDGNRLNAFAHNLRWTTRSENMLDKWRHGTMPDGEKCVTAKLATNQVQAICRRALQGESMRGLAREFGLSDKAVRKIKSGAMWRRQTAAVRARLEETND